MMTREKVRDLDYRPKEDRKKKEERESLKRLRGWKEPVSRERNCLGI